MVEKRTGKKTGPKPRFTESEVIDAAMKVGIADFTLAQVAKQLGVATSAVYRLFDSRSDLLHGCLGRAAQELKKPIPETWGWQEILYDWVNRCWELFDYYPGLALTIMQHPSAFIHLNDYFRYLVERLVAAGLSPEAAAFALDFAGDTVVATHVSVSALNQPFAEGKESEWEILLHNCQQDAVFQPDESWQGRGFLDAKIDFIVEGLARRMEKNA